jgi:Ca-activated chloride channel family protein
MLAMEQFKFGDIRWLWLIFIVPALALLYAYGFYQKKRALRAFASIQTLKFISSSVSRTRQVVKAGLVLLSMVFLVLTLMRPWGDPRQETVRKKGRDVVFLLDVSRSMLAQDLKPNRLERAKMAIQDVLKIMEGDRVGLVIFSGNNALKCPLTHDYDFFLTILEKVSPEDVSRGGTNLGDAIRTATRKVFGQKEGKFRDIILITDGEDHGSMPKNAAEEAAKHGIRIHTVGLGSPDGTRIPIGGGQYLQYNTAYVRSKLDEKLLREIAAATLGTYIPVRTGTMDLGQLYKQVIATAAKREEESRRATVWSEWYQSSLLVALALLVIESLIGERRKAPEEAHPEQGEIP